MADIPTDFRAELQLLFDDAESFAEASLGHHYLWVAALNRAHAALAEDPVGPTLMERAMTGDATAAKQFLHQAGFTDKDGQWLPQYQPIPDATND
jgi:hypothetical protein